MSCINVKENMNASIFPLSKGGWLTSSRQTLIKKGTAAPYALNESEISVPDAKPTAAGK